MGNLVEVSGKYEGVVESPLIALKQGDCVVLSIKDSKMRLKKRVQNPVLMIAPTSIYGADDGCFIFSMPGYGSEIINMKGITSIQLYRIGMTMKASGVLVEEIRALFN